MAKSDLEELLVAQIEASNLPPFEREYRFHPKRRWRFDIAFPDYKVACEVQGGIWSGGAHGRGSGIAKDYEKLNEAMVHGWSVVQFHTNVIKNGTAIETLERLFLLREASCTNN